jgi:hypothetical protein
MYLQIELTFLKSIINLKNFTTMKKQIFVLMLALFASITMVYSQAVHGSDPIPLDLNNCSIGPLNPIAGVPFDYSANIIPANGSAYWYATTATTFMQAGARVPGIEETIGGGVVAAATNYMDNTPGDASPTTTTITWTTDGLAAVDAANPLFVAIEYTAAATDCSNNMKVYRINPINAFTVDIMNWDPANTTPSGYGNLEEQCYDLIESAVFNIGSGMMDYDFGTNIMFFEVVAANFTESFTPSFQISGLQNNQTAVLEYGVVNGTYTVNLGAIVNGVTLPGQVVTTNETNTSQGVSIYVRVTIANNDYEGLTTDGITLAVDAINSASEPDVDNDNCANITAFSDAATQNLQARPTVTPNGTGTFVPQVTP